MECPEFPQIADLKKRAFLAAFAEAGSIRAAARAAGVSERTPWNWLHRDDSEAGRVFQAAFDDAKRLAGNALEAEARRRATEGVRRLRFYRGEPIIDPETGRPYFEHEYSDVLLIFLLKGAMPEKYRERFQHEHRGLAESSRVRVIEDDDWYGNSDRIAATLSGDSDEKKGGNYEP